MAEIIRINENTWRIEDGMVRFFFLTGSKKAMFIDSGVTGLDLKEVAAQIADSEPDLNIRDLPIMMLNTHADPDHVSGNNSFSEFYMHPDDEPLARMKGVTGRLMPLENAQIIDLGDRSLRIIHIPGHTAGSVAVLDISHRALFSGDSVQSGNIYMFGPRRSMELLAESLDKLDRISNGFDVIYPSHDSPEVKPEIILKLLEGVSEIIENKTQGENIELFGTPITWYRFSCCGFYCDRAAEDKGAPLVKGIHHISLKCKTARELDKVKDFYVGVLKLRVIRKWEGGMMIDTGSGLIEVNSNLDPDKENIQGVVRHFALLTDNVDRIAERVRAAGYELFMEPTDKVIKSDPEYPIRIAFCYGPLGEEVEFFHER